MTNLPFDDTTDFEDADRGLIGSMVPCVVTNDEGRVVWDNDAYAFLDGECPATANPSLWRQSQLCAKQGLFEVTDGIYQVRGLDLSNMTLVEGDEGVIVIDPLISKETAAAALALYRDHRGDRQVTAVIYTHAHGDHFGGVHGIYREGVPIVAGHGFMEAAIAENVYAGGAMNRRAEYMYGSQLEKGPAGQIGAGLGQTTSLGSIGLIPPTLEITHTGQEETLDGVLIRFQMTPGTECPVEMNFLFPEKRALCMAENATHNLHNLLTLRGAVVRDARIWAHYLNEAIDLFADDMDVAFASHHWPMWGKDRVVKYLSLQRDLYAYLHDQTLRLMNQGYTGIEIAEMVEMPPALESAWHTHGYYGSVSHNVKAIYQRYLGWFDGNPAHLWQHPPVEAGTRYVDAFGGADVVIGKAQGYIDGGDLRFAAELLNHVVFADDANTQARELLAGVYDTLGHGAENGTWRNFYLQGAYELRNGVQPAALDSAGSPDMVSALAVDQLFDSLAIRVNGPKAWDEHITIDWVFTDLGHTYRLELINGVLIQDVDPKAGGADLTLTLTKAQLLGLLGGGGLDGIATDGDTGVVARLLAVLDPPTG
jgi:alkyl sulfatase BDS1-like metallo-beta-lactamase superfamily hydrolase